MTRFLQALVEGLGTGSILVLLALGYVIIYKATRIISFAQPGLMVVGASWAVYLNTERSVGRLFGEPGSAGFRYGGFVLSVVLAMLLTALVAAAVERAALRPMVGKPVFSVAIITIGIDVVLRVLVNRYIGINVRPVGDPWGINVWNVGGVFIQQRHVAMVAAATILVAALLAFFRYSRIGLAMRAAAYDQETALAQGISVGLVFSLSWAIAGGTAAVAGAFAATGSGLDHQTWIIALAALPAIILGGLDSIGGAVVGGLVVGVVEAFVATYQNDIAPWLGSNFFVVSPYVLMLLVLLFRPYGLFGTPEVERV